MALPTKFTVYIPAAKLTATCTETTPGVYLTELENGKSIGSIAEEVIRDEISQGLLTDMRKVTWLH